MDEHCACAEVVFVFVCSALWLQRDSSKRHRFLTWISQRVPGLSGLHLAHHRASRPWRLHQFHTVTDRARQRLHCCVVSMHH